MVRRFIAWVLGPPEPPPCANGHVGPIEVEYGLALHFVRFSCRGCDGCWFVAAGED
jgi:hypothetical protein